jgi:hypothetical protein
MPFKVTHILEVIDRFMAEGRLKLKPDAITTPITYHDPCQIGRNGGLYDEPGESSTRSRPISAISRRTAQSNGAAVEAAGSLRSPICTTCASSPVARRSSRFARQARR